MGKLLKTNMLESPSDIANSDICKCMHEKQPGYTVLLGVTRRTENLHVDVV